MATFVLIVGLVLAGILTVLSVIAFLQSNSRSHPTTRAGTRTRTETNRYDPSKSRAQNNVAKGQQAEAAVRHDQLDHLPESRYSTYHSLYVPRDYDQQKITEIDHVVVSRFGVFVIETKSWQGTISGGEDAREWTLEHRQKVYRRSNPLNQNQLHVRSLTKFLGLTGRPGRDGPVFSVVCFQGDNWVFGNSMPTNVISDVGLNAYITSFDSEELDEETVARANERLIEHMASPVHRRYRAMHDADIDRRTREPGD